MEDYIAGRALEIEEIPAIVEEFRWGCSRAVAVHWWQIMGGKLPLQPAYPPLATLSTPFCLQGRGPAVD